MATTETPAPSEPTLPRVFSSACIQPKVLAAELGDIARSRRTRGVDPWPVEAVLPKLGEAADNKPDVPPHCGLVGLALSGGGIRSASFCLGVLQSLARANKLRLFDHLSTVSGGGYVGSAWSALLNASSGRPVRQRPDFPFVHVPAEQPAGAAPEVVEADRAGVHQEPAALVHVRDFANYLIPRGLRDQLRVPALLARGILINLLMVLPFLLLLAALTLFFYGEAVRGAVRWSDLPGLVITRWVVLPAAVVIMIAATAWQKRRRAETRGNWIFRGKLLGWGAVLCALSGAIFLFELQQYALYFLTEVVEAGTVSVLGIDFWGLIGAIAGLVSAAATGEGAGPYAALRRRLALFAIGLLGPLALWLLYLWICRIALQWDMGAWLAALICVVLAGGAWLLGYLTIDINKTSLHSYYRDRLSRAFIMGVHPEVPPAANTCGAGWRVRHRDELKLSECTPERTGGPYHLINAVVNNPDFAPEDENRLGDESQRGRRGDFFVFAPRFCGNERLGYCATPKLENIDAHVDLATAMAISAAAAAPGVGRNVFGPFGTFLLAMLNVRLGYWMRKPASVEAGEGFNWPVGPIYYLAELIGWRRDSAYINLTDGGHLENLGIFELLRRRCRYIVAIDAEADPGMSFGGLATVQRLARTDLGVDIRLDLEDLRKDARGLSRRHFALCRIDYGDGEQGELLYIKSSLTGTEIEYIQEYARTHPDFPHETTGDQFFDEGQFEAYRALGEDIGRELVSDRRAPEIARRDRRRAADTADAFFAELRDWLRPAAPFKDGFLQLTARRRDLDKALYHERFAGYLSEIHADLVRMNGASPGHTPPRSAAGNPGLRELEAIFQPAGSKAGAEPGGEARENGAASDALEQDQLELLQIVNQQMQFMEQAMLELNLEEPASRDHPRNRGLMNLFHGWSQSPAFRTRWSVLIGQYSQSLQVFGRYALGLEDGMQWRPAWSTTGAERAFVEWALGFDAAGGDPPGRAVDLYHADVLAAPSTEHGTPAEVGTTVALAALERRWGYPVLRAFRIRDTYRNLRLSEPLLEGLARTLPPSQRGLPFYYDLRPPAPQTPEDLELFQRLTRVVARVPGYTAYPS